MVFGEEKININFRVEWVRSGIMRGQIGVKRNVIGGIKFEKRIIVSKKDRRERL